MKALKITAFVHKVVTSDDLQKTAEMVIRVCRLLLTTDDQNWMAASPSQVKHPLTLPGIASPHPPRYSIVALTRTLPPAV